MKLELQKIPYQKAFYISQEVSNNAFSFGERKVNKIYVPRLVEGSLNDVEIGKKVVFDDFDDDGYPNPCVGLRRFVKTTVAGIPTYVFDNHNHAFCFWNLENINNNDLADSTLIHIDEHKDTRKPEEYLSKDDAKDPLKVFKYTNTHLNVGNFIPAAQKIGLIKELIIIDSQASIDSFHLNKITGKKIILDIDLDFFSPELDYIGNDKKIEFIQQFIPLAKVITFATSPFFIEQKRAIEFLHKICKKFKDS